MTQEIEVLGPDSPEVVAAVSVDRRVKATMKAMKTAWVRLAEDLYMFSELKMWKDLGYEDFHEWLADPEVGVDKRWAYVLIANWREFVVNKEVEPEQLARLEPAKIQEVSSAVRRGIVTVEQAMADVETLSRSDLRQKYGPTPKGHAHDSVYDAEAEPSFIRCPVCNSRVREEEINRG